MNVEYLSCGKVEALGYFEISHMKYNDRKVVTKRVGTSVLKIYFIWTVVEILEHVIGFQRLWDSGES